MSNFHNVDLFDNIENDSKPVNNVNKSKNEKTINSYEKKDVIVQIRDQETTSDDFVNYIIEINVKSDTHMWLDKIQDKSWSVCRRYREFDDLRTALIKRYPACVIPPLPSKISSLNPWSVAHQKKDADFIDCRRQRLEMFLNRILLHPKLREELLIFNFLSRNEEWNDSTVKKDLTDKVGSFINWRWINVQSRLINIFDNNVNSAYLTDVVKSNSLSDDARNIIEKGKILQDNIKKLLGSLTKVDEQTALLHHLYKNYGEAFFDWCSMDQSIGDTLQSFGHMCDTFSTLIDSPAPNDKPLIFPQSRASTGGVFTILSWNEISLLLQELYDFGESWIELGGRMAFLHRQLAKEISQTENKKEQLERLKNGQPMKSGGFSSITNKFKKSLSESEVSDLRSNLESTIINDTKTLDMVKANKELFDQCVDEEIKYFDEFRSRDMHILMHSYACNQLSHSERCLRLWQRAKQTLE